MAFGEILRNAREQRGMTHSDVAESTHLLVQVVENLEREDLRRIAAPIYGRGFIKLYAELLELDPEPLVRDFMEIYNGGRSPVMNTKPAAGAPAAVPAAPAPAPVPAPAPAPTPAPAVAAEPIVVAAPVAMPVAAALAPEPEPEPEPPVMVAPREDGFVVAPEAPYEEPGEPDLFRPLPVRPRQEPSAAGGAARYAAPDGGGGQARGGRWQRAGTGVADVARNVWRGVVDGVTKAVDFVDDRLPPSVSRAKVVTLAVVGLAVVVFMGTGIRMLFKMTGGEGGRETLALLIERQVAPPAMYVD